MKLYLKMAFLTVAMLSVSTGHAQIIQQPGTDYLVVEAEAFANDDLNDEFTGWLVISPDDPEEVELHNSNPGTIMVPPPSSNPSQGQAIFDQVGGGDFADQIGYELQFATPGVYYLYSRYSLFDLRDLVSMNYGNEDSVYLPVESLDEDPALQRLRDSRDGFSSFTKDIPFGSGNEFGPLDGCRFEDEPWVIPDEECDADELRGEEQFEGQYHWQPMTWNNDLGHANYVVEDTGVVLDFNVATRERGTSVDAWVLSQNPDLSYEELDALLDGPTVTEGDYNSDGLVDGTDIDLQAAEMKKPAAEQDLAKFDHNGDGVINVGTPDAPGDRLIWVKDLRMTSVGDSNLDDVFDSGDLVFVFGAGKYDSGLMATWAEGDWSGDMVFDSGDLVLAFQDGGYVTAAAPAVPEPTSLVLAMLSVLGWVGVVRRRSV